MFRTIIWATDGSDAADGALAFTEELARALGSKIVAVHATHLVSGGFNGGASLAEDDDVQRKIKGQVEGLRSRGLDARLNVRLSPHKDTPHAIVEAAEDHEADLIVVGTHGKGGVPSALFGGVAKRLARLASCPVLVVPAHVKIRTHGLAETSSELHRPRYGVSQDVASL